MAFDTVNVTVDTVKLIYISMIHQCSGSYISGTHGICSFGYGS